MNLKEMIKKYINEDDILYHGRASKYDSKELLFNRISMNPNHLLYGYGIYLTDSVDVAKYYATGEHKDKENNGYIYKLKIKNNAKICNWYKPVPEWLRYNILKTKLLTFNEEDFKKDEGSFKMGFNMAGEWNTDDNLNYDLFIYKQKTIVKKNLSLEQLMKNLYMLNNKFYIYKDFSIKPPEPYNVGLDKKITQDNIFNNLGNVYAYLYYYFHDIKKCSEFLLKCGLDAILVNDSGTDSANGNTYVILDKSAFAIQQIERLK